MYCLLDFILGPPKDENFGLSFAVLRDSGELEPRTRKPSSTRSRVE